MDSFLDPIFSAISNGIISVFSTIIKFIFLNGFTKTLFYLLFFNGLGLYLMYFDKKLAIKNGEIKEKNPDLEEKELKKCLFKRISENTLLLTALIGGSLGVLGGMYLFKHKTLKPKFRVGVPIIIGLQVILIIYIIIRTSFGNAG